MATRINDELNRLILAAALFVLSNQPAWSALLGG